MNLGHHNSETLSKNLSSHFHIKRGLITNSCSAKRLNDLSDKINILKHTLLILYVKKKENKYYRDIEL